MNKRKFLEFSFSFLAKYKKQSSLKEFVSTVGYKPIVFGFVALLETKKLIVGIVPG
jgi:hypothetical protein